MSAFFLRRWFLVLAFLSVLPVPAASIPKLFSTGVNESGNLLEPEQVDPHYTITASADETAPGPDAFTLTPGYPIDPWVAEGPRSRWIAPQPAQATGNGPGTYTYSTSFDLTGLDPATAQINGALATDDTLGAVRLNGTPLEGILSSGFTAMRSFSIPVGSPFVQGTNTLEFDVTNGGAAANPTGLRVEMTGLATGPGEVPSILAQPQSQTVVVGDLVILSVDAIGLRRPDASRDTSRLAIRRRVEHARLRREQRRHGTQSEWSARG